MRKLLTTLFTIFFVVTFATITTGFSQNLVRNASFDALTWPDAQYACPTYMGAIGNSKYWNSALGSVDYMSSCANDSAPHIGVPNNVAGFQEAFSGSSYSAITVYSALYVNAREFLWQELDEPLKENQGYYLEFMVNLSDSSHFAVPGLGAFLSDTNTRTWEYPYQFFDYAEPQVVNPRDSILDNKDDWVKISGTFIAEGGEKYLTIGCFNNDLEENIQHVDSFPEVGYNWELSYYFIDAVVLQEDNSIGISKNAVQSTKLYPNPSSGTVTLQYSFNTPLNALWQIFDLQGRSISSQNLNNGISGTARLSQKLSPGIYVSTIMEGEKPLKSEKLVVY